MAFVKGNKFGKGGARKNSGPDPDWVKAKMQDMGTSPRAFAFLKAVIEGEPIEEKKLFDVGGKPITVWESASVDARVRAWNSVMDRGFGKAIQALEHTGTVAAKLTVVYEGIDAQH